MEHDNHSAEVRMARERDDSAYVEWAPGHFILRSCLGESGYEDITRAWEVRTATEARKLMETR
jgi:hypothetical protein